MERRSYRLVKAGQRASRGLRTGSPLAENLNAARGHFHVPPTGFGSNASPVQSENSTAPWGSQCPRGPHGFGRSPTGAPCSSCIPPPAANSASISLKRLGVPPTRSDPTSQPTRCQPRSELPTMASGPIKGLPWPHTSQSGLFLTAPIGGVRSCQCMPESPLSGQRCWRRNFFGSGSGFAQSLEVGKILLPAHRALVGDELRPTDEGDGDVAVSAGLPTRPAFLPGYSQE